MVDPVCSFPWLQWEIRLDSLSVSPGQAFPRNLIPRFKALREISLSLSKTKDLEAER